MSLKWQHYYMGLANKVAEGSKDPSTKVGCVIADESFQPVSMGYNGHVSGADESLLSLEGPMKYSQILHAELNAVIFAKRDLKGCVAFITHAPCSTCLKVLLQAKVRKIIYESPGPAVAKSSDDEKRAMINLIKATKAVVMNVNNKLYTTELEDSLTNAAPTEVIKNLFDTLGRMKAKADEIHKEFLITTGSRTVSRQKLTELFSHVKDGSLAMMTLWFKEQGFSEFSELCDAARRDVLGPQTLAAVDGPVA